MGTKTGALWRDDLSNIEESLKYMYQRNIYCDITVKVTDVKDGSSMYFYAHKLVLATRSSVFADIFYKKPRSRKIVSVKCSPRAFDIFLWYIYTDVVETDDIDELLQTFKVATKYKVFSFREICVKILQEKVSCINKNNVCSVMKIANLYQSNTLRKVCLDVIQKELENVFVSDDFLTLNENTVWDLLKNSKLNMCPKQMLETIMKWMKHNKVKDRKFLSFIDFSGFTADDFLNIVEQYPDFFSGSEIRAVLSKLTLTDTPDLPAWCTLSRASETRPSVSFLYERLESIKLCSTKVQTDCNRSFNKITLHGLDGFEQEMFIKIIIKCNNLKLVMIELAFGSEFVPPNCLMIELYNNINPKKRMKSIKFHLIPSLQQYYLLIDENSKTPFSKNFNLLLVVKACRLLEWGSHEPVSNHKFRVASVSDCSEIKTTNRGLIEITRLKTFLDWLLFINPENGEKKFIITALFFDTNENSQTHLNN